MDVPPQAREALLEQRRAFIAFNVVCGVSSRDSRAVWERYSWPSMPLPHICIAYLPRPGRLSRPSPSIARYHSAVPTR
jgi:hypothetical protein